MLIREMQPADLEKVAQLEAQCFSQPWQYQDFEKSLTLDYYYFVVALADDKIIGQAGLIISDFEADITNVAVHPDYRRQGTASQILTFLLEKGREKGISEFTLEVRQSNEAAISLYRRMGFQEEGIRRNFYDRPKENALIMWKREGKVEACE